MRLACKTANFGVKRDAAKCGLRSQARTRMVRTAARLPSACAQNRHEMNAMGKKSYQGVNQSSAGTTTAAVRR